MQEKQLTEEQEEDLEALMTLWDTDGDGLVSLEELRLQCVNAGVEEVVVEGWFKDHDADGNENLSKEEFKEFFRLNWSVD